MTRFDLISPRRRRDGKTHWQKVGAAFPRQNGGFSLVFDALPLPDNEGRVSVLMTEPKPRDGGNQTGQATGQSDPYGGYGSGGQPSSGGIDDDEIPFAPEWRA